MNRKRIPYGTKLPVTLTLRQRDLIQDHTLFDSDFASLGLVEGEDFRIDLSLEDIEEIQGFVAAEANHCEDRKLQKELDTLFDLFQELLDTFDDQEG